MHRPELNVMETGKTVVAFSGLGIVLFFSPTFFFISGADLSSLVDRVGR